MMSRFSLYSTASVSLLALAACGSPEDETGGTGLGVMSAAPEASGSTAPTDMAQLPPAPTTEPASSQSPPDAAPTGTVSEPPAPAPTTLPPEGMGGAAATDPPVVVPPDGMGGMGGMPAMVEKMWDPEFIWIADFLRMKCVNCHSDMKNGNLVLASNTITNDEVRIALDGVASRKGGFLVEPGNAANSKAYKMITNSGGEQFPKETTDRFAAWINAGTHYYVQ